MYKKSKNNKSQNKINKNQNKGITLIALVITIIVLLILAGVTIMMLMGSENAPQKASEAVEKDAIAGAKDEVAMEAQSALLDYFNKKYVEGNSTDSASIQSEVAKAAKKAVDSAKSKNKQLLSDSGVTDNTITLKTKSYTVTGTIDENGSITWGDIVASTEKNTETEVLTAEQIAQNPEKYYGKQVINYKANDEDTNVYRIFYVDEDNYFGDGEYTIYLKADYSENLEPSMIYNSEKTKVKEMNPEWAEKRKDNENTWYISEKISAWLCDTSVWSKYCNSNNELVNYAIGAPSLDMYMKSYNQAFKSITDSFVFSPSFEYGSSYGYYIEYTGPQGERDITTDSPDNSLNRLMYDGMYCNPYDSNHTCSFLCTPSADSDNTLCCVDIEHACFDTIFNLKEEENRSFGICPIISLKSSFKIEIKKTV